MNEFKKVKKRMFGIGGKESETFGIVAVRQPLFEPLAALVHELIAQFNPLELVDLQGRQLGGTLLQNTSNQQAETNDHELFFVSGKKIDDASGSNVASRKVVSTPFLRFEKQSIVQSYAFAGANSFEDVTRISGMQVTTIRFGLEFFGASIFSKFFNFAPSVVATVYVELNEKEFALRTWKEVGRTIYQNKVYQSVISALDGFCQKWTGSTIS